MTSLYSKILEVALFPPEGSGGLVAVAEAGPVSDVDETTDGSIHFPRSLFPDTCQVRYLLGGENFLQGLSEVLSALEPTNLFILPPMLASRFLSAGLRTKSPRLDLQEIALQVAKECLAPGSLIGILLPPNFFAGERPRSFREQLFQDARPRLVVTHDHRWSELGVHPAFRLHTLVMEVGEQGEPILRFFKHPQATTAEEQAEIVSDLQWLLRKGGGRTKHGYVLRDGLPPGAPLLHEMYHPDLVSQQEDMSHFGEVRPLGELVEARIGMQRTASSGRLSDTDGDGGVPAIEARHIRKDGSIAIDEVRYWAQVPSTHCLRTGDLCLRRIIGNAERLYIAQIQEHIRPLVALDSVLVLRPKPSTTHEDQELLLAYLRSGIAAEFLRAQGIGISVNTKPLLALPVPIPDKSLSLAISSLNEAVKQFDAWKAEAEAARSSLFEFSSAKEARLQLLSVGRLSRRRYEAAARVDDFRHRVRTQFPHPIAYRWRTVESSRPDLEGYVQLLECAEVAVCYLACIATVLVRDVEGGKISRIGEMAKSLSGSSPRGTNMGDWIAILREARDRRSLRNIPDLVPFAEVLHFLKEDADRALQSLAVHRNDQAHGRGPKGAQIGQAFTECCVDLEALLQAAEFLSEYRLRYVERTRRDSFRRITRYEYRDLVGDHALVPLEQGETEESELEAQSLYLVDRAGGLHLLRPLLTRWECPLCGTLATFYLDSWVRSSDSCVLKSMERGHTIEDSDIAWAFRQIGLLRPAEQSGA